MISNTQEPTAPFVRDYSLVGENTPLAIEHGLTDAEWYQTPVPKEVMRELLQRRDGPAIRDTLIWFGLLIVCGWLGFNWWGSWWAVLPFAIYGIIYGSSSDSRWHESGHGTAFKTDWMNNALYNVASFMVMREPKLWRWSHTRHHSDTLVVGRDPEISVTRPSKILRHVFAFTGVRSVKKYFTKLFVHAQGRLMPDEATYVPEEDRDAVVWMARIHLAIYGVVIVAAVVFRSILPLMYIGLPNIYGHWLLRVYSYTQHAGMAENVLDHRLNSRTVLMNVVNRYLYWNMNYHVEHHIFPLVPYYNLPKLHAIVKHDLPDPCIGLWGAYREILPAVWRQRTDPGYYLRRELPDRSPDQGPSLIKSFDGAEKQVVDGWVEVCTASELHREDVCRFDYQSQTFAVYRTADGRFYATDGMCTHGQVHLAGGFVRGDLIECSKHNGRFDVRDGSPRRLPVCVGLTTYPVKKEDGVLWLNPQSEGGAGVEQSNAVTTFRVVQNENVATYIKELVLEPLDESVNFQPGDYLQINIPAYDEIRFSDFAIAQPYADTWRAHHVRDHSSVNPAETRRNYSLASNPDDPAREQRLHFNVRIATPPPGQDCLAGIGSSYVWGLKPGDTVTAIGPFGDFHIKPTSAEMVYVGGGSGMAPLRSHLSYLFETLKTDRKVSFWYGARSTQELFYVDYFEQLASRFENFEFHIALSEPADDEAWVGPTGFIHEVLEDRYLSTHPCPGDVEYYLCGPPKMISAMQKLLTSHNVRAESIAFDEF